MPAQHWPVRTMRAPRCMPIGNEWALVLSLECAGYTAHVALLVRQPGPTIRGAVLFGRIRHAVPPGGFHS